MNRTLITQAYEIFRAAVPTIRIHGIGGRRWKRKVAKGGRVGPWLQANYQIVDSVVWGARRPCLYLVAGDDGIIRYVGISRNRLKDRWRLSPGVDAETMLPLSEHQLFHSQCWKHIEREMTSGRGGGYEVRCIGGEELLSLVQRLGPPLSAFAALRGDSEGTVAGVERWLCNNRGPQLVSWNRAMTA